MSTQNTPATVHSQHERQTSDMAGLKHDLQTYRPAQDQRRGILSYLFGNDKLRAVLNDKALSLATTEAESIKKGAKLFHDARLDTFSAYLSAIRDNYIAETQTQRGEIEANLYSNLEQKLTRLSDETLMKIDDDLQKIAQLYRSPQVRRKKEELLFRSLDTLTETYAQILEQHRHSMLSRIGQGNSRDTL